MWKFLSKIFFSPAPHTHLRLICIFFLISLIFRFPDLICLVTVFEGERCIITSNLNSRDYPSKKRKNLPFFVTGILFLEKSKKVNSIFFLTKKYRALTLFINKPNSSKKTSRKNVVFMARKKKYICHWEVFKKKRDLTKYRKLICENFILP